MLLKDKTAIITGGGRGIGRGIVRRFADEGAQVVLAECDRASGERTQEEIEKSGGAALFVQTDVAQRDAVERLVATASERVGRIDILINNAWIAGLNGPFLELTQETWGRVVGVNLTDVFNCQDRGSARAAIASLPAWAKRLESP
jgi:NAD(P)-dependent dehydrogenase (short-subunit alcohol dehydrogenase family)